jgi:small nuclear ribonucleoprotein (snRNP)-like protein
LETLMIAELVGLEVVVDLRSGFVCLGMLSAVDDDLLVLTGADFHDLGDTKTSRENYIVDSRRTGIKPNRKRTYLIRTEVVAITRFDDVIDE